MPEQHPSQRVIDWRLLGNALYGARARRRMSEAAVRSELKTRAGIEVSRKTYYAIERGDRAMMMDEWLALLRILDPPGGWRFFEEAARGEFREAWPISH